MPAQTKFVELALNIIDPDGAWDPEKTLEFGDAARVYLGEYPITLRNRFNRPTINSDGVGNVR